MLEIAGNVTGNNSKPATTPSYKNRKRRLEISKKYLCVLAYLQIIEIEQTSN